MKRLTGPTPEVRDQRDAIDILEGCPYPPARTGSAADALVPDEWYPGAFGWTEHACNFWEHVDEETGDVTGEATLDVPDDMAAAHQGKEVTLTDGRTVVVDLSGAENIEDPARVLTITLARQPDLLWRTEVLNMPGTRNEARTLHDAVRLTKAACLRLLATGLEAGEVQLEALRFVYAAGIAA